MTAKESDLNPLLTALGKISFNLSALEHQLKILVWVLLGGSEQRIGQCVTAELSFRGLVGLAHSLHEIRQPDPKVHAELDALLNKCVQAEEQRNQVIHSNWGPSESGGFVRIKTTAKKGKGLQWKFEEMALADVEAAARAVHDASKALGEFMGRQKYKF